MDGFRVMPCDEAAEIGDVFVTLTGNIACSGLEHFEKMKDGAIVANSGHFNVELDLEALAKAATKRKVRPRVRRGVHASQRKEDQRPRRGAFDKPRRGGKVIPRRDGH